MDLGLKGKVAIVTGASDGIGYAAAWEMANEGADVVICARTKGPLENAANMIKSQTSKSILPIVCDVTVGSICPGTEASEGDAPPGSTNLLGRFDMV